jgi:hypothetical protein
MSLVFASSLSALSATAATEIILADIAPPPPDPSDQTAQTQPPPAQVRDMPIGVGWFVLLGIVIFAVAYFGLKLLSHSK